MSTQTPSNTHAKGSTKNTSDFGFLPHNRGSDGGKSEGITGKLNYGDDVEKIFESIQTWSEKQRAELVERLTCPRVTSNGGVRSKSKQEIPKGSLPLFTGANELDSWIVHVQLFNELVSMYQISSQNVQTELIRTIDPATLKHAMRSRPSGLKLDSPTSPKNARVLGNGRMEAR
eukprot:TRINITY_DN943_c0_g1_i1.p1 TRINITY_DN943_c0_g1~~TRINITY_DN943_c0_g1_i1.p1  ORF type:complete len:174 (-),score=12.62 TRINITY_DN943_c0_g1_i1:419-940(-)